jgi:PAS domain S-box-containing protein
MAAIITGKPTAAYIRGIADLASHICNCSYAQVSILDEGGQLIRNEKDPDVEYSDANDAFIREVTEGGKVYQLKVAGAAIMNHTEETAGSVNRFYAGVPLIRPDGFRIGALWVTDKGTRFLDEQQQRSFLLLGTQLVAYLEVERKNQDLEHAGIELLRFNDLFNYSNEIHCITDGEGKIKYINNSIYDLLGYLPAEVMNKTIWDFCVDGERERSMPIIHAEIGKGKDRFQIQTKTITKSGELRWFEWSDVIKDGNWLINGRDVTRRKQAEMQAKVLTLAVEKSSAGVFIRNVNNEVTWMNEAMENLMGYTLVELKGKVFCEPPHRKGYRYCCL